MKNCPEFETRVNEYLDKLLAPPERADLERHLERCEGCRAFLAALRSLREKTASLPRSLEPARDLWPEIRSSLAGRRPWWGVRLPFFPAETAGLRRVVVLPATAAIAAATVLIAIVAAWMALRSAGPPDSGPAPPSAQSPLPLLDAGYRGATEQLQTALRAEGGRGASDAVKVIEENLRIVEGAIKEVHRAAEIDPGRGVDERLCVSLYRTRFELLRQAVRLSSQGGEEKSS